MIRVSDPPDIIKRVKYGETLLLETRKSVTSTKALGVRSVEGNLVKGQSRSLHYSF